MAKKEKNTPQPGDAEIVAGYMQKLEHPLKAEIEAVRNIIKNSNGKISERIKWNAPSYYYKEDFVTFNHRALKFVHLVFHHVGITEIKHPLLEGDYKDRRMLYLHDMEQINAQKETLESIINQWIDMMDR